jgi:hypothetical protein
MRYIGAEYTSLEQTRYDIGIDIGTIYPYIGTEYARWETDKVYRYRILQLGNG